MRLISGPAGSGKTCRVLEEFRGALRRGDTGAALLTPTATLAQHLQNRLAREGLLLRPRSIQTLSRFIEPWTDAGAQVSEPLLYLLVEAAAQRVARPEFARVARLPGFCAALARAIEEFSSAGCTAARLARHLPAAPLAEAFAAVYEEVERELARRGLAMRAQRLERAAARIAREGLGGIHTVWLDGFHALPEPEFAVIEAMGRHASLILTLPAAQATETTRARLLALGLREERCDRQGAVAERVLVEAANIEREADEIARRILEQAAAGREFREMGIIVRNPQPYEPVLRAALERFGIPARFYFDAPLADHPAARFLSAAVEALLGGWEWGATLAALRLDPRSGDSPEMDRFDFAVRERLPGRGLAGLKEMAGECAALNGLLDGLERLEAWRAAALRPQEWAGEFRKLRRLAGPPRFEPATHAAAGRWRAYSAALEAFDAAVGQAASDRSGGVPLAEYWREVKAVLRLTPLRVGDVRRNVVHVLGAHEARQWRLPVVFVCGLVEKQFPRFHAPDPFFPDAARRQLNRAGIRVRTAAELESEECFLFESAVSRAEELLVLSYPRFDARGEQNLPSVYLDGFGLTPAAAPAVRPAEMAWPAAAQSAALRSPDLLKALEKQTARMSPTALESYLQCPFQYFARRTLRLEEPPAAPEQRLDAQAEGAIIHAVLAELYRSKQPLEPVFERVFRETRERLRIPAGFRVETRRHRLLEDLRAFVAEQAGTPAGEIRVEESFVFELEPGLMIGGRIDRLDVAGGRAVVVDYKYSGAQTTKAKLDNPNLLQPPLYLMAVERAFGVRPAGFIYYGLRGGVERAAWEEPIAPEWLEQAAARSRRAAAEIRGGEIAPRPADTAPCVWCEARDVCRYRGAAAVPAEEA